MAFLIDQLNNSGLFAQSAYSAGIATCDSDGNVITATYLSSVDLTPYQTKAEMVDYQTVSGMTGYATTGDVANKLDTTAFNIPDSANWNSNYETVQNNSATWNTVTDKLDTTAYTPFDPTYISGAIDNKLDTTAFSDVSGTFLTAHQSLDGYATTAWVDSQGYLTAHQPISADEWNNVYETVNVYSGSWTGESSPTAVVDSHGSIDIVSSNNTVYFDVKGTWFNDAVNSAYTGSQGDVGVNNYVRNNSATIDNVNTTVQSNSSTWNTVNNKLNTTAFSDVSGTFLTAHQSLEDYATTAWVDSQGYLTELPASAEETLETVNTNSSVWNSVTGKEDTISYGYSAGAISSINGSALLGETIPYEVYGISAGDNVTIWEENNTLWISAEAGQGGDVEVNDLVHSNSAIWDDVTNKLDTTAYIPFDPTYISGVIDNKLDSTAFNIPTSSNWNDVYNTVNSNSGLWSAGDTEVNTTVQNNSATWDNVSNKLDTTSFSDVSGSFLTAHQSLDGYATTAWVDSQGYLTAHQPISADEWNDVYNTVNSNSGSWSSEETILSGEVISGQFVNSVGNIATHSAISSINGSGFGVIPLGTVLQNGIGGGLMQFGTTSNRPAFVTGGNRPSDNAWSTGNILILSGTQGQGYYKGHQLFLSTNNKAAITFDANSTTTGNNAPVKIYSYSASDKYVGFTTSSIKMNNGSNSGEFTVDDFITWSGYGSDISYLSATIGDAESLLAQL